MASTTANYGFTKPDKGATGWDVDLNKNFDDIDTQIKARADESASRYTKTEADNTFAAKTQIGDLAVLSTTAKDSIVNALNEVFNEVNNGKTSIYGAIVDKGVTPSSQAFADLVTAIGAITTGGDVTIEGTATAPDILEGKTATVPSGVITGTMVNNPLKTPIISTPYVGIDTGASDYGTVYVFIPKGAYLESASGKDNESAVIIPNTNIKSENLKSGITFGNITGKSSVVDTADADAVADDIAAHKTAYVNGEKVEGTGKTKFYTVEITTDSLDGEIPNVPFKPKFICWEEGRDFVFGDGDTFSGCCYANLDEYYDDPATKVQGIYIYNIKSSYSTDCDWGPIEPLNINGVICPFVVKEIVDSAYTIGFNFEEYLAHSMSSVPAHSKFNPKFTLIG